MHQEVGEWKEKLKLPVERDEIKIMINSCIRELDSVGMSLSYQLKGTRELKVMVNFCIRELDRVGLSLSYQLKGKRELR